MTWLKTNLGTLLTAVVLLLTAGIAYGRMAELAGQINAKADRAAVVRELDQIQRTLERIEGKLDDLSQ